jgi:hypothetical protein
MVMFSLLTNPPFLNPTEVKSIQIGHMIWSILDFIFIK